MARRVLTAAALVVTSACSSGDDERAPTSSAVTTTSSLPGTTSSPAPVSDPARSALDDVVAWMADPASVDPSRLADSFLSQLPVEQLRQVLTDIGVGEWRAVAVDVPVPGGAVARVEGPGPALVIQIAVDDTGRITSLLFQPADLVDPPTDLDGLVQRLQATAPVAGFLRADIAVDGTCAPVAELAQDAVLPIGSVFKLFVLGAVAAMVSAGELAWDAPIEIRDELDSLPSGTTQDEPAGSALTVEELALRMISISDNTATDHLIDLVGRDRVEQALVTLGHSDPAATTPMLTTREMFVIKTDPDLLARYQAADIDGRRALLAGEVAASPLPDIAEFPTSPSAVTTVEWFASPADVCRALVALDDLAQRPGLEPVRDVLAENPGVPVGGDLEQVLFKGGSEPGVLFTAWLATRPGGSRIVVTGGVVDEDAPVDPLVAELLSLGLTLS